jgi:hypothetical protein
MRKSAARRRFAVIGLRDQGGTSDRRSSVQLAAVVLVAAPSVALAEPPARIDNIWKWRHHEPSPAQARRAEHAKSVLPLPGQPATTTEVEDLYRKLMRSEGVPAR